MKVKIDDNIPLPENWSETRIRGNMGWSHTLRDMKEGQSFSIEVTDKKSENELNGLRAAIYALRKAKFGRCNLVIRLIKSEEMDEGIFHKTYRVWKAPLTVEIEQPRKKA